MRLVIYPQDGHMPAPESGAAGADAPAPLLAAVRQAVERLEPEASMWVDRWREVVEKTPPGADVLILVAHRLSRKAVRRLRDHAPSLPPVVVVTDKPLKAAHTLRRAEVHGIVGGDPEEICQAVMRAAGSSAFERAARVAERHPRLSPLLREWIARTLRAHPPYPSVASSLRDTTVSRRTLRRHWNWHVGILAPKRWLSHVQLARARALHFNGRSWTEVAAELEIRPRTLGDVIRRLTGQPPVDLEDDRRTWEEDFDRVVTAVLAGGSLE